MIVSHFDPTWYPTEDQPYDDLYFEMERHELADDFSWFIDELKAATDPALQIRFMEFIDNLGLNTLGYLLTSQQTGTLALEIGIPASDISETSWHNAGRLQLLILEHIEELESDEESSDAYKDLIATLAEVYDTITWALRMDALYN